MTISKRQLTKWRKEALKHVNNYNPDHFESAVKKVCGDRELKANQRIIQMTQELLDQQLLKEK